MKKYLIAALLAFAVLLTVTGCAAVRKPDAAKDKLEAKPGAAEPSRTLTAEQAQQIALDHVGLTADQTARLRTEYEIDNGVPMFNVELRHGDWDYELDIHAESGQILSYDRDHKYD